jgi:MFS family permease
MTTQKILTRDFVLSFLAQFAFSFVSFILVPTIPVYLSRFEAKAGEIGFLIGILSVFSLIPRPFIGRALLRIPERKFMMAGAILYILSSIAYLAAPPFWPFLIVRVLQGVGLAFFSTASVALIANISYRIILLLLWPPISGWSLSTSLASPSSFWFALGYPYVLYSSLSN